MNTLTISGHRTRKIVRGVCLLVLCEYCSWSISALFLMNIREDQTIPYWDAKNEETLAQIPPPQGASLKSKGYLGEEYGRWLDIEYHMGELSLEEVFEYYDQHLQLNGWTREDVDFDSKSLFALYIRDKSCLDLD